MKSASAAASAAAAQGRGVRRLLQASASLSRALHSKHFPDAAAVSGGRALAAASSQVPTRGFSQAPLQQEHGRGQHYYSAYRMQQRGLWHGPAALSPVHGGIGCRESLRSRTQGGVTRGRRLMSTSSGGVASSTPPAPSSQSSSSSASVEAAPGSAPGTEGAAPTPAPAPAAPAPAPPPPSSSSSAPVEAVADSGGAAADAASMAASSATAESSSSVATAADFSQVIVGPSLPTLAEVTDIPVADKFSELNYTFSDGALRLLEAVHTLTGLEYGATIIACTVAVRLLLVPINVYAARNSARLAWASPHIKELQDRISDSKNDPKKEKHLHKELRALMEKYRCNPLKAFAAPALQLPIFVSFFFALRKAGDYLPAFSLQGPSFSPDLTAADPTLILPLLNAVSFFVVMETNPKPAGGMMEDGMAEKMRLVLRGVGLMIMPLTYSLPSAVFLYWLPSNALAAVQTQLLSKEPVKRMLNIPLPPPPDHDKKALEEKSMDSLVDVLGAPNPFEAYSQYRLRVTLDKDKNDPTKDALFGGHAPPPEASFAGLGGGGGGGGDGGVAKKEVERPVLYSSPEEAARARAAKGLGDAGGGGSSSEGQGRQTGGGRGGGYKSKGSKRRHHKGGKRR